MMLLLVVLACTNSHKSAADSGRETTDSTDSVSTAYDDTAGDSEAPAGPWEAGQHAEITVDGQVLLVGTVEGVSSSAPLLFALDTGADRFYVDADLDAPSRGNVQFGEVVLENQGLRSLELAEAEAAIGWDLAGLAGQPLFESRVTAFNYPASTVHFFDELPSDAPPQAQGSAATLPYTLTAGIPVVELELGGGPLSLIADTGSGVTLVTESAFAALDDGNRPRLDGYLWLTSYGQDEGFVTRIPAVDLGDHVVPETWAVVVPDDNHLLGLLTSVGLDVDGFLGFPFYREHVWVSDGPGTTFRAWFAADRAHVDPQEWQRVGVEPMWVDGRVVVGMLYRPSSAEGVLELGDVLVSLDGIDVTSLSLDDVKRQLRGEPGSVVVVGTDRGDFSVARDDLLP